MPASKPLENLSTMFSEMSETIIEATLPLTVTNVYLGLLKSDGKLEALIIALSPTKHCEAKAKCVVRNTSEKTLLNDYLFDCMRGILN